MGAAGGAVSPRVRAGTREAKQQAVCFLFKSDLGKINPSAIQISFGQSEPHPGKKKRDTVLRSKRIIISAFGRRPRPARCCTVRAEAFNRRLSNRRWRQC